VVAAGDLRRGLPAWVGAEVEAVDAAEVEGPVYGQDGLSMLLETSAHLRVRKAA
jgi:hypothetical protein